MNNSWLQLKKFSGQMLPLALIVVSQLVLLKTTWLKVLPPTNGFFLYWSDLASSQLIYKDFYFPLPPLGLWVLGDVPKLFPDPLLAEQIVAAFVWIGVSCFLYLLIREYVGVPSAFFAAEISLTLYLTMSGNITAGYFELAVMFVLASAFFYIKALDKFGNSASIQLVLSGAMASSAFLVKQSFVVIGFAIFVIFFLGSKTFKTTNFLKVFGFWVLGVLLPIVIVASYLAIHGVLIEAIASIFSGGGKNVGGSPWPLWFAQSFMPRSPAWPLIGLVLLLWPPVMKKIHSKLVLVLIGLCLSGILGLSVFSAISVDSSTALLVIAPLAVSIFLIFVNSSKHFSKLNPLNVGVIVSLFFVFAVGAVWISWNLPREHGTLFNYFSISELSGFIRPAFVTTGVIGILIAMFKTFGTFQESFVKKEQLGLDRSVDLKYATIAFISLAMVLVDSVSGGGGAESFVLAATFAIAMFAQRLFEYATRLQFVSILLVLITVIVIPLNATQIRFPYNWFGIQDLALTEPRSDTEITTLRNFDLSTVTADYYFKVDSYVHEIHSYQEEHDLDEQILIGTNIAGLAGGVIDFQEYSLKCPIMWWDICPEDVSKQDFEQIKNNPPTGIIWNIAPDSVIEAHEIGFRQSSKSAIGQTQRWILDEVDKGCYKVIGRVDSGQGSETASGWQTIAAVRTCI